MESEKKEPLIPPEETRDTVGKYRVYVNSRAQPYITKEELLSNKICTSKYNCYNCIPKILYEQFSQVGNLYFLFLAVLQMLPNISQSGGSPIMLLPLMIVVTLNGFKDFLEDYKRKSSDNRENQTKCEMIAIGKDNTSTSWENIKPGDIVKIHKDEYFPADLLLLYSTNTNGVAYVETKNLDGETNLKYKESIRLTYKIVKEVDNPKGRDNAVKKTFGVVHCDNPNAQMYEFEGVYYFDDKEGDPATSNKKQKRKLGGNSDLHKSVQTYAEKKIFAPVPSMNNSNYRPLSFRAGQRRSKLLQKNSIEGIPTDIDENSDTVVLDYNNILLRGSSLRNTDYIYGAVVYVGHNTKIMLNSLSARTKTSKVFKLMNQQLMFIIIVQMTLCTAFALIYTITNSRYKVIYYEVSSKMEHINRFCFSFCSWLLCLCNIVPISLLVTIEMIKFCQAYFISNDCNMYDQQNKRCAIVQSSGLNEELGQIHNIFTDKTGTLTKNIMQFKYMVVGQHIYGSDHHADPHEVKHVTNVDFNDNTVFEHWNDSSHHNSDNITTFIFALALCHSIIVEKTEKGITYNASSPDELALVNAAKYFGVEFTERTDENEMILKYKGQIVKYKLLHIFEFNSNRKRMSVVIKDQKNNIKIICKGADSVIMKRLDHEKSEECEDMVMSNLENFGRKGLRTLMIAQRDISPEELKYFTKKFYDAYLPENFDKKQKILDDCYESLEKNLILLGATAIEDCLQDNLQPTLEAFREVGVKIFMLTGDHPFTAVSIAHSCGLIGKEFKVCIVSSTKHDEINKKLTELIDLCEKDPVCFVITGDALLEVQKPTSLGIMSLFLIAIAKCTSFIGSRVSPKQKAELVSLIKKQDTSKTSLAIGDGANDVNMITTADVGVGIMGNEGQQAARASDYILGQFSFLRRLLFVHGREAYRKNSFAVGFVLWKNFVYVLPIIFFGLNSYLSGQQIYDPLIDALYNIIFTAYPIGWFATYDKELNYDRLESKPKLYKNGMDNSLFNYYVFAKWYLYAIFSGLIIYFLNTRILTFAMTSYDFHMYDLWSMGAAIYTSIVFVVNFKLMISTNTHNIFSVILLIFSLGSYVAVLYLSSTYFISMKTYGSWNMIFESPIFAATIIIIILTCSIIEYGWRSMQFIVEELIAKAKMKKKKPIEKKKEEEHSQSIDDHENRDSIQKGLDSSINPSIKAQAPSERVAAKPMAFDTDTQRVVLNKKYTGFAFSEDVANVSILHAAIEDNFFENEFQHDSSIEEE